MAVGIARLMEQRLTLLLAILRQHPQVTGRLLLRQVAVQVQVPVFGLGFGLVVQVAVLAQTVSATLIKILTVKLRNDCHHASNGLLLH